MVIISIPIIGMVDYGRIVIVFKNDTHVFLRLSVLQRIIYVRSFVGQYWCRNNACGSADTVWTSETVSIIDEL